jgi:hypothetical protein
MMRWIKAEIYNAVRDLSRHTMTANQAHMKALLWLLKYCIDTKNEGWTLKPKGTWYGKSKTHLFAITARSDSDYAACTTTRRSVTGYVVCLKDAPIMVKSAMQKTVALSTTEAELNAAVQCTQEMLFAKNMMDSLNLRVTLPMKLQVDNKSVIDIVNGWSIGGRTRHFDTKQMFLRELKEKEICKSNG